MPRRHRRTAHPRLLAIRPAWLLAAGLTLAACQSAPGEDDLAAEAEASAESSVAETATPEPPPEVAALPPEPPPPPEPVIDDDPDRLFGLDRPALSAMLGEPALIRREAPAEIWQYRSATCVFDVFLYDAAGTHRVEFLEARDSAARKIDARACLNQLLRARMGLPLG